MDSCGWIESFATLAYLTKLRTCKQRMLMLKVDFSIFLLVHQSPIKAKRALRWDVKTPDPIPTSICGIVLRHMYWNCSGDMVKARWAGKKERGRESAERDMGPSNPNHWYANTESNLWLPDKEEGVVLRSCLVDRPIHLIGGHGPACGIEKIGRLGPRWEMQLAINFPI